METSSPAGSDDFTWTDDDDDETGHGNLEVGSSSAMPKFEVGSSSSGRSNILFRHFVMMGYSDKIVTRAIEEENENADEETILNTILTFSSLENSPRRNQIAETTSTKAPDDGSDFILSDDEEMDLENFPVGNQVAETTMIKAPDDDSDFMWTDDDEDEEILFDDSENCPEMEENLQCPSEMKEKLSFLKEMQFPEDECLLAIQRCGPTASVDELLNCISAAQLARAEDPYYTDPQPQQRHGFKNKKKTVVNGASCSRRQCMAEDDRIRFPNPMIGYGVPTLPFNTSQCTWKIPEEAIGPPYFYFENVAFAPKGVWDEISRSLYGVLPEFVDSQFICAANRKRGYVHNLPIDNRFPILPLPPLTIQEAIPMTDKWWPAWDKRTKLNCLVTAYASAQLTDRLRKKLEVWNGSQPPPDVQKFVIDQCKKWNLVWVGRNKLAPLEPNEVEILLGFPENHTRGGGLSRTDRYTSLGNSFQVDTVAYHLSVLKRLFPNGIKVLSLFSGIGGGEVALHRLGVPLRVVVSVEISPVNQSIMQSWWEETNQDETGTLIHMGDVKLLTDGKLEELIAKFGGFDFVIGGSPCNNLAGGNRHSRDGLVGKESSLFYEYSRILETVKRIMARRGRFGN